MDKYLIPTYNRIPLSFTHGKGAWLFSSNGKKYLDFVSGIAVTSLGHSHPKLTKTIAQQSKKILHVSNLYQIPEQEKLAKKLCRTTGYEAAFFANSGAEANEAAMKLAKKQTGRKKFISFATSFHGRTLATLSITGKPTIKKDFTPLLPNCKIIKFNDIKAFKKTADNKTAAVIFEFIQAEGGVNLVDKKFVKTIFDLAKKYKFLTIADEVQTGIGRTGKFLAAAHFGVKPDITSLAKGLGGGFPIGAILTKNKIAASFSAGTHASTFGGNPLACATALTVVNEIINSNFLNKINHTSTYLQKRLKQIQQKYPSIILKIKGMGLLLGIEIIDVGARDLLIKILREKYNILTTVAGKKVLRILPPLIIGKKEIDIFCNKLEKALNSIR
jgi:predicted acetylornithine/succinylornithine family transaminase